MKKVPENIQTSVKNTVGYAEAVNKESFMAGSGVAFGKSEKFYTTAVETLEDQVRYFKTQYEQVSADMRILVSILNKYGNN